MSKVNLWVFDIDGTVANNDHRKHHLADGKREWDKFFSQQHLDDPYEPVFRVMRALSAMGDKCIFLTGRAEQYRQVSLEWIQEHYHSMFPNEDLYMRPQGDHTDDDELKWIQVQEILDKNPEYVLCGVFDDRHRIIDKFRENGVYVFECNQTREFF